jgi:hypothetical protein
MTANDLCYFNFKTRNPSEINWYLYHKVGCRMQTRNGKNYMFSIADRPGVVYLPLPGPSPPVTEIAPKEPPLNSWVGIVGKAGMMGVVVGVETLTGFAISLDDPLKAMWILASIKRAGLGFGAGLGLALVYISGVSSPDQVNGYNEDTWDFNLSLGPNWGKAAGAAAKYKKFKPVLDFVSKVGAKTPHGFKKAMETIEKKKLVELAKKIREVNGALGLEKDKPQVFLMDVPWIPSGGAEVSLFWGWAEYVALWSND